MKPIVKIIIIVFYIAYYFFGMDYIARLMKWLDDTYLINHYQYGRDGLPLDVSEYSQKAILFLSVLFIIASETGTMLFIFILGGVFLTLNLLERLY